MCCPQCQGIENLFDEKLAGRELQEYRSKGPSKTTTMLIEGLKAEGVDGLTLLDIGGGVGAIQHGLLTAGVAQATDVDASQAYLRTAQVEASRRGLDDRVEFRHGDFTQVAPEIQSADIVTLDRVLCCYPGMQQLVGLSVSRARKLYGLVYPRDRWWVKLGLKLLNLVWRLRKSPFRNFAHPTKEVEALLDREGFQQRFYRRTLFWQVVVYTRG